MKNLRIVSGYERPDDRLVTAILLLLAMLVNFFGLSAAMGVGNSPVASVVYAVICGHAALAFFYAIAALGSTENEGADRGCLTIGFILCCACVSGLILLVDVAAVRRMVEVRNGFKRSCGINLTDIGFSMKAYADHEGGGYLPPLSTEPGLLSPDIERLYPNYLPYLSGFSCVELGVAPAELRPNSPVLSAYLDRSYYYLGYEIDSEAAMKSLHDAYLRKVEAGESFNEDIAVAPGAGSWGSDTLFRLRERPQGDSSTNGTEPPMYGDESSIPVMIERPGNHIGRTRSQWCNVLYLDGHVARHPYPDEWPVTEEMMALLASMDRAGWPGPPEGLMPLVSRFSGGFALAGIIAGGLVFCFFRFYRLTVLWVIVAYLAAGGVCELYLRTAPTASVSHPLAGEAAGEFP